MTRVRNNTMPSEIPDGKPLRKCDMHVHASSLEQTYDRKTHRKLVEPGGLYRAICRVVADHWVQPMVSQYIGADLPKINELFIQFKHDLLSMLELARLRGMDYFAVTDHDTIEPVMRLLEECPDLVKRVIVGEEVTAHFRDGIHLDVGVFGLNEGQHREIQGAKGDLVRELVPYLDEQGLLYALFHPFKVPSSKRGEKLNRDDILQLREIFAVVEKRNGLSPKRLNELAESFFEGNASIGGSDSHRRHGVGVTYTAAYANSKEEFLEAIRNGEGKVYGVHGSIRQFILEIVDKVYSYGSVARFAIPDETSLETREVIENVLRESGQKLIKMNGSTIVTVPIEGRWRIHEALLVLFSIVSSPIYASVLHYKETGIDRSLL